VVQRALFDRCFEQENFPKETGERRMPASDTIASVIVVARNGER